MQPALHDTFHTLHHRNRSPRHGRCDSHPFRYLPISHLKPVHRAHKIAHLTETASNFHRLALETMQRVSAFQFNDRFFETHRAREKWRSCYIRTAKKAFNINGRFSETLFRTKSASIPPAQGGARSAGVRRGGSMVPPR